MIDYWHHHDVRLSVCNAVHGGSQGRCSGLKVVPACSSQTSSYLSFQTLLLSMYYEDNRSKQLDFFGHAMKIGLCHYVAWGICW